MEKESKKKKQKKSLINKTLIGLGVAGVAILVVRAMMHGKHQKNECRQSNNTLEPPMTIVETASKKSDKPIVRKKEYMPSSKDEALLNTCNKLLKTLWKSGNPDSKLYFDDEIYFDIKQCSFPPFITQEED